MDKFIKKLCNLNGKKIKIVTIHKWFGRDEYRCELNLINDEKRIGFRLLNSEIYLLKDEVIFFNEIGGVFCLKDDLMEIIMMNI
jgi:hypothetical protein